MNLLTTVSKFFCSGIRLKQAHEQLLIVLNSLDAIVYVADMNSYEVLLSTLIPKLSTRKTGKNGGHTSMPSPKMEKSRPLSFGLSPNTARPAGYITSAGASSAKTGKIWVCGEATGISRNECC